MRLYSNDSHWNGNTTVAYCLGHLVIMRRTHLGLQSPPVSCTPPAPCSLWSSRESSSPAPGPGSQSWHVRALTLAPQLRTYQLRPACLPGIHSSFLLSLLPFTISLYSEKAISGSAVFILPSFIPFCRRVPPLLFLWSERVAYTYNFFQLSASLWQQTRSKFKTK